MLDLLLRHYRGKFDRIYLYSRSASLDKGWDPLRKYIEEVQHVNLDEEPCFFDEFNTAAIQNNWNCRRAWQPTQKRPNMTKSLRFCS